MNIYFKAFKFIHNRQTKTPFLKYEIGLNIRNRNFFQTFNVINLKKQPVKTSRYISICIFSLKESITNQ